MNQNLIYYFTVIFLDFFTAFGLYSLLYLLLSIFIKKSLIKKVDEQASKLISLIGILYFLTWIIGTLIEFQNSTAAENSHTLDRMFGKYWFGYWLQPLIWILITQLLRVKKNRKNVLLRILFCLLLIISIERFVIIVTSFHRDYLPSSWTMYSSLEIYPSNFILELIAKIIYFLVFVGIFTLAELNVKKLINIKTTANRR